MSTKELIESELQTMDESQLTALYPIVKQMAKKKSSAQEPSLMEKLRRITIDAPEDFATNLNLYASGEKSVE